MIIFRSLDLRTAEGGGSCVFSALEPSGDRGDKGALFSKQCRTDAVGLVETLYFL